MKTLIHIFLISLVSLEASVLPFATDFEVSEGFSPGMLPANPDWLFDPGTLDVEITDTESSSGQQSLQIQGSTPLRFSFQDSSAGQIRWVDFFVKPVFGDDTPATIESLQSAVIAFVKSGATGEVFLLDGDIGVNGAWVSSGIPISLAGDRSTDWIRLTYRLDYAEKSWGLFIDKQLVATSLGFWDDTFAALSELEIIPDATTPTSFDYFYAGGENPLYSEHRPYLYAGRVSGLSSDTWTTVTLPRPYTRPVVVATPIYERQNDVELPSVIRVRGLDPGASSFEIKVQSPSGSPLIGYEAEFIAAEQGVYTQAIHGVDLEVGTLQVDIFNGASDWTPQYQIYPLAEIGSPIVLGQVQTYTEGSRWSAFWSSSSDRKSPATSDAIHVGLHLGEDSDLVRAPETVGYLLFDAYSASVEGHETTAGITAANIASDPVSVDLSSFGISSLTHIVATQAAMDGGDGSWVVLNDPNAVSGTSASVVIDEDQVFDTERIHMSEQVSYLAIGAEVSTDSNADGLPDWWQQWYVDVNPFDDIESIDEVTATTDGDEDGVADYTEDMLEGTDFTNPYDNSTTGPIVYVDALIGDDLNTGRAPVQLDTITGPKQTLSAGLGTARDAETIEIAPGTYSGSDLLPAGKSLTIRPSGSVTIQ